MALNPLHTYGKSALGPAMGSFPITPADGADLATDIRAITLNAGGTLSWVSSENNAVQTTAALPPGTYPLLARRIRATGTTATGLTGWV
ncbi:spike base protein, RCAP_Rcc01079 family [Paracoccus aeridis]|uniref:spike base protein, RCAP_Rcc01079 family n=1 Tax=Paracoccus aeridis TaxID=1966466 RepID=UPI0010A9F0EC|nr:hypothetical protein [Paracoccus aeridis]